MAIVRTMWFSSLASTTHDELAVRLSKIVMMRQARRIRRIYPMQQLGGDGSVTCRRNRRVKIWPCRRIPVVSACKLL